MKEKFLLAETCSLDELKQHCLKVITGELSIYCFSPADEPETYLVPIQDEAKMLAVAAQFEVLNKVSIDETKDKINSTAVYYHDGLLSWLIDKGYCLYGEFVEVSREDARGYVSYILGFDQEVEEYLPEVTICPYKVIRNGKPCFVYCCSLISYRYIKEQFVEPSTSPLYSLASQVLDLKVIFGPPSETVSGLLSDEVAAGRLPPTPEFEAIIDVFKEFWSNGKDGEKKDQIVDWIIKKYKFSKKTAEVIDTVCRPKLKRKGGLSKLNISTQ